MGYDLLFLSIELLLISIQAPLHRPHLPLLRPRLLYIMDDCILENFLLMQKRTKKKKDYLAPSAALC